VKQSGKANRPTDMGVLSLLVKLGVDSTQFETGIKRAQSMGEKFGSSFKSAVTSRLAGALSVAAVTGFANSIIKAADDISDLSEQLNVSTDDIQRLQILAGETGVAFEKFSSVLNKFEEARLKATSGDVDSLNVFKALGLSLDDLTNAQLSNLELSIRIAEAYKQSGRSAETTAAMTELYGLKLKTAGAALAEFQSISDRGLISKQTIDDLAKANAQLDESIRMLKVLSAKPASGVIEYFANFIDQYNEIMKRGKEAMGKTTYYNIHGFDLSQVAGFLSQTMAIPAAGLLGLLGIKPKSRTGGANFTSPELAAPAIGTLGRELLKSETMKFSLGGAQDPLSRIGGFGAFSSGQSEMIRQAIDQKRYLQGINKNTEQMARDLANA
jgi:hypothetical protein